MKISSDAGTPGREGKVSVTAELILSKGIKWVILTQGGIRTEYKRRRNAIHRISPAEWFSYDSVWVGINSWWWWSWHCCRNKEERKGDTVAIHTVPQAWKLSSKAGEAGSSGGTQTHSRGNHIKCHLASWMEWNIKHKRLPIHMFPSVHKNSASPTRLAWKSGPIPVQCSPLPGLFSALERQPEEHRTPAQSWMPLAVTTAGTVGASAALVSASIPSRFWGFYMYSWQRSIL